MCGGCGVESEMVDGSGGSVFCEEGAEGEESWLEGECGGEVDDCPELRVMG